MRRLIALTLALPALLVLAAASQPVPVRPGPQSGARHINNPQYAAWIPPGTYSAIVLNSSGDQRRWAVSLMSRSLNVPIVVPPVDNIVIPFKDGWTVKADDEARLVSNLVPFEDSALYNKVGEQPRYVLSAWGITAAGPVPFVYKDVKSEP
jgi:hypothetical protein